MGRRKCSFGDVVHACSTSPSLAPGNAAWDPPVKGKSKAGEAGNRVLVFWRKPEEWGEIIYTWVVNTGQNRSIMTFFELTEGDLVQATGV